MDRTVKAALRARIETVLHWMTDRPRATTAPSLLRVILGLTSIALYIRHYSKRQLFFGPNGVYGEKEIRAYAEAVGTWNVYTLGSSPVLFDVLFHAGIVVAAMVTLGVGGRVVLAIHYVLLWSLFMSNPSFMDGGDALAAIALPFLLMTRCYSAFRLPFRSRHPSRRAGPGLSVLNNTGLLLLVSQVCIVYLMAGLYKVQGSVWQDGTALYYILRVPEFFLPKVTPLLFHLEWILVLGAYGTVLVSIFFPVLVWFRGGRPVAVTAMLCFHLAIGVLMGLTSFALVMAAFDVLFVNGHVEGVRLRFRQAFSRIVGISRMSKVGAFDNAAK